MGKITGNEQGKELPEKVLAMYGAVMQLIEEGADIANLKVSDITEKAGIGKGTAYDYFDTKEDIIVFAILYYMEESFENLEKNIWKKENFAARINYGLASVDTKMAQGICVLRFINLLFESSRIGQRLGEVLRERSKTGNCQPLLLGRRLIERGIQDGEIRSDLPISYMTYMLVVKFFAYLAFIVSGRENKEGMEAIFGGESSISYEEFGKLVVKGIMEELGAEAAKI